MAGAVVTTYRVVLGVVVAFSSITTLAHAAEVLTWDNPIDMAAARVARGAIIGPCPWAQPQTPDLLVARDKKAEEHTAEKCRAYEGWLRARIYHRLYDANRAAAAAKRAADRAAHDRDLREDFERSWDAEIHKDWVPH